MAKADKSTNEKPLEPELRPDGWQRFETAVDAAVRTKPARRDKQAIKPPEKDDERG